MKKSALMGPAKMIIAMILSGTIGWFVIESGQSSYNVVFFRCLFGAVSLGAYCALRGLYRREYFGARTLVLMIVGGICLVLNWLLLFSSYRLASISISTVVYHTQPFYLVLFGPLLFGETINRHKIGALLIAFSGVLLVSRIDLSDFSADPLYLAGLGLALGAAFLYTIASIITKQLKHVPPHLIALVQVTIGILLLLPFVDWQAVPLQGAHWYYLGALGLVHTCLMYILLYGAIQTLPVTAIAALSFIYPAVAVLIDLLVYGRALDLFQIAGMMLILFAALSVNLNWRWMPAFGLSSVRRNET